MANVIDVGQFIYDKLGWIDAWKLQKLSYYVQSWSLVWDGDPIFEEKFEAWPDGPVSPDLHRDNKFYRSDGHLGTHIDGADSGKLTDRQKAVIQSVLEFYGSMSKKELVELTHRETPWQESRGNLAPDAYCKNEIRTQTMRSAYSLQALCMQSVPAAPVQTGTMAMAVSDEALADEVSRWKSTLDWLSTR